MEKINNQFVYIKRFIQVDDNGVQRNFNRGQVVVIQNNAMLVSEIVQNNEGIELDNTIFNKYEDAVNAVWNKYKSQIESIEKSNDPTYIEVAGKKSFDIATIREQRDAEIKQLRQEYAEEMTQLIEDAQQVQTLAVTEVTQADEQKAKDIFNRFKLQSLLEYDKAKVTLFDTLDLLTESELMSLSTYASEIVELFEANETNKENASSIKARLYEHLSVALPVNIVEALRQLPGKSEVGYESIVGKALEFGRKKHNETVAELQD